MLSQFSFEKRGQDPPSPTPIFTTSDVKHHFRWITHVLHFILPENNEFIQIVILNTKKRLSIG